MRNPAFEMRINAIKPGIVGYVMQLKIQRCLTLLRSIRHLHTDMPPIKTMQADLDVLPRCLTVGRNEPCSRSG